MERKLIFYPILLAFLSGCAERGFQEPLASYKDVPATTTYTPEEPFSRKIGTRFLVDGLSQISDLKLNIDSATAQTTLKGFVTIRPTGGNTITVPFEVAGTIDPENYAAYLKATNQPQLDGMGLQVGAKLTCLDTSCSESFIDLYVNHRGYIYHHQVEAKGNELPAVEADKTPESSASDEPVKNPPSPKVPKAPLGEVSSAEDDGSQYEHDISDDVEMGPYVGEPKKDLEVFFPDTSAPVPAPTTPAEPENSVSKETPGKNGPVKNPSLVKAVLRGLGQAVTGLGRNNFVRGHLENPANILDYQQKLENPGFQILYPKRKTYFGTDDMLAVLSYMGNYNQANMKGYVINVGDISAKKGGKLGRHSSHQMGLDADISYYFNSKDKQKGLVDAVSSSKPVRSFMAEEQWELFKTIVGQGNVDRIFIHPALKKELCVVAARKGELKNSESAAVSFETLRVLRPEVHHDDHYHLRLKCSEAQPRCRQMAPPPKATGCP